MSKAHCESTCSHSICYHSTGYLVLQWVYILFLRERYHVITGRCTFCKRMHLNSTDNLFLNLMKYFWPPNRIKHDNKSTYYIVSHIWYLILHYLEVWLGSETSGPFLTFCHIFMRNGEHGSFSPFPPCLSAAAQNVRIQPYCTRRWILIFLCPISYFWVIG